MRGQLAFEMLIRLCMPVIVTGSDPAYPFLKQDACNHSETNEAIQTLLWKDMCKYGVANNAPKTTHMEHDCCSNKADNTPNCHLLKAAQYDSLTDNSTLSSAAHPVIAGVLHLVRSSSL